MAHGFLQKSLSRVTSTRGVLDRVAVGGGFELEWLSLGIGFALGVGTAAVARRGRWLARARRSLARLRPARDVGRPVVYGVPPPPGSWTRATLPDPDSAPVPLDRLGDALGVAGVARVVLVHGTFVGDDPFALVDRWRTLLARLDPGLAAALRGLTKQQLDRLLGDAGNFPPAAVGELAASLGDRVPVELFVWSSANHHVPRLRGARDLALSLAPHGEGAPRWPGRRRRLLLVGHSHAGQVFALLTHLLERSVIGEALRDVLADEQGEGQTAALERALDGLRRVGLDLVTLGAPPRYGYCVDGRRRRLLHVVNHRGDEPRGGSLSGVLHTRDGDYVQQWGVSGSDLVATTARDRGVDQRLDALLGVGSDTAAWVENVRARHRVHPDGQTLLVDFRDATRLTPNLLQTGLGHAVYTTRGALPLILSLAVDRFYSARDAGSMAVSS